MVKYLKNQDGKFAGSIGDGKRKVPVSRDVATKPRTEWGIKRAVAKNADKAAQFALNMVSGKYDHVDRWKMLNQETFPGISDNDLVSIAVHTKSKHLVDDWYAACRKFNVDSLKPFDQIPDETREQMALHMLYNYYRRCGTPYVGGM